jgi:hypothetical protein
MASRYGYQATDQAMALAFDAPLNNVEALVVVGRCAKFGTPCPCPAHSFQ